MSRLAAALVLVVASTAGADERPIHLQFVGDLNLGGNAAPTMAAKGFAWAFDGTRELLAEGDLNVANLETPVTSRGRAAKKTFTFRMPAESLDATKAAGITLVSLANNHTLDQGPDGLSDTLESLDARGIARAGAGRDAAEARAPAIVEVRGLKVGFLSYSLTFPKEFWATPKRPGTAFGHEHWVRADVAALRSQVDLVVAAFHWGAEKRDTPKDYQRQLARAAIEAGADAVIGHHPHVLQGLEFVDGRPVVYSLGNYAFGSSSNVAKDSALARFVVRDRRIAAVEMIPLHVHNRVVDYNPRLAEGEIRERVLTTLERLSGDLGAPGVRRDGRLVFDLAPAPAVAAPAPAPEPAPAPSAAVPERSSE